MLLTSCPADGARRQLQTAHQEWVKIAPDVRSAAATVMDLASEQLGPAACCPACAGANLPPDMAPSFDGSTSGTLFVPCPERVFVSQHGWLCRDCGAQCLRCRR